MQTFWGLCPFGRCGEPDRPDSDFSARFPRQRATNLPKRCNRLWACLLEIGDKDIAKPQQATKALDLKNNFLDITKLIRSIQRAEGDPDCFGTAEGYCDQVNCAWRRYCLEKPQEVADEKGQDS